MPEIYGSRVFSVDNSQIAYQKFGNGPAIILAFHGFGQTNQVFQQLEKPLGEQFTIYAIDLFFHGNSRYAGNEMLTNAVWCQLMGQFLRAQAIDRFSLMGFSLGGRFALVTAEAFAIRLDQLILIAPDGITNTIWYRLATSSQTGRSFFLHVLRHLSSLTAFGHALTRIGLLNRTAMRFAEISLATPEQRTLVYQSWTQFRLLYPNLDLLAKLLNDNPIRILFLTGSFDRIVPGFYILPLTKRLFHYKLTTVRTGHNHLIDLVAGQLNWRQQGN